MTTQTTSAPDTQKTAYPPLGKLAPGSVVAVRSNGSESTTEIISPPVEKDKLYWYKTDTHGMICETWIKSSVMITWDMFKRDGAVVEIRALLKEKDRSHVWEGWGDTLAGYFDNYEAFYLALKRLEQTGKAKSIYTTLNPVKEDLAARAYNRLIALGKDDRTTSDDDITRRCWLLLDADPIRPSGVSATDAELEAACARMVEVEQHLTGLGWPEPIRARSGNGTHRLYPISLPNDNASRDLIAAVLNALQLQFGEKENDTDIGADLEPGQIGVKIDTSVYNASRIDKAYGTTARKGDDIPTRPHRPSYIESVPAQLALVTRAQLEAVAAIWTSYEAMLKAEEDKKREEARAKRRESTGDDVDVIALFNESHDIEDLLTEYGYLRTKKSNRWDDPRGGGSNSILVDKRAQKAYAFSPNAPIHNGHRFDCFDLRTQHEHNGDRREAYIAVKKELNLWQKSAGDEANVDAVVNLHPTPGGLHVGKNGNSDHAATAPATPPAAQDTEPITEAMILACVQEAIATKAGGKIDPDAMRKVFELIAETTDKYLRTQLRSTLPEQLGIRKSDYDDFLSDAYEERLERRKTAQQATQAEGKMDTGSNEEPRYRYPYSVRDGVLQVYIKSKESEGFHPIAQFDAQITEQHVSESGQINYTIEGCASRRGTFKAQIDAESFSNAQKLKATLEAAAGALDPVHAGKEKYLGPAIKMLSLDSVRTIHRYERTGWSDNTFLIPGREPENVTIQLSRKLPYRIDASADLDLGLEAIEALIQFMGSELGPIVLTPAFQAPMADHAGWRDERYGLFIRGRTGTHKSSVAQGVMCLYGPAYIRDDMLIKWGEGATRNAIMAYATSAHDLPFLIDNYKPSTGGGANDFVNLVHNILEGGEKERLNRASQLRETKPIYAWPIFTGEDIAGEDPASLARVLCVSFPDVRNRDTSQLTKAQQLSQHLCAVGSAWLAWLETDDGKQAARAAGQAMPTVRQKWAEMLIKNQPHMVNPYRVATNLATNQLAWATLAQHPSIGTLAQKYSDDHRAGLKRLANEMGAYTAESLEAVRFVAQLRELLASGRVILLSDKGTAADTVSAVDRDRVIGWIANKDLGDAYLLPDIALAAIKRITGDELGYVTKQTLYDQLDSMGMIASKDKGQTAKTARVGGKPQKVLHLTGEAIKTPERPEEDPAEMGL